MCTPSLDLRRECWRSGPLGIDSGPAAVDAAPMPSESTNALVIGAGIQGAGVAQALAAAGHEVVLIEQGEIASGTSSRSSKLIHGGLRYLESLEFSLVADSLAERRILLEIAPHLVRLVPFFIPVYRQTSRGPLKIRTGLGLYALLGRLHKDARFRCVPPADWQKLDGLNTRDLRAVFQYWDGQTDDAALCRAVVASATDLGAQVWTATKVIEGQRISDHWAVRVRRGARESTVNAKVVVNAAGPWANKVLSAFSPSLPQRPIELVGGTHIEVQGALEQGIYYTEAPTDKRAVFTMPWKGRTLVGTTETPFQGDPAKIVPTHAEVEYLRGVLHHHFPDRDDEVLDAWAGLRVLPSGAGKAFRRSREVMLAPDDPEHPTFLTVYGGKLTGYRATAQRVLKKLSPSLPAAVTRADTQTLKLPEDPSK